MELACKKNLAYAKQTRKDGFSGDLGIAYSEEGGDPMTALRDEELTWLRNKVKTIYYCSFNGKSLRYMYPSAEWWNEMPGDFPNVQEITIDYTVLRYAYEDPMTKERKTQDFQEVRTPEYCAAFERGEEDADFAYPAQYMKLYDLAKFMEEHELKLQEANDMTEKADESNNELGPLGIDAADGTRDSDTSSTPERSADSTSTDDSKPLIINGEVVPDRGCKIYLITTVDFKQRHYTIYSQVSLVPTCKTRLTTNRRNR